MIATHQDRAIHISHCCNDWIGRVDWHDVTQKHDRMTTNSKYLRDWIRNVVVEQEMQPRDLLG